MIAWFAKNGVAANLLMGVILVAGFFSVRNLKMEMFPEFDLDLITVTTLYPGAAPAEVEEGVCKQIEEKIWDLTGIKELNSYSRENVGVVSIEVARGKDTEQVADEVKVRVDAIANFPEEAEKPLVEVVTSKRRVMAVAIHGDCDEKTLRFLAERMRDGLTAIPGITQVEIAGIRKPEIGIEVSERSLREHGLSFNEVATVLRRSSVDVPGGVAKTASGETLLRVTGKARVGREFEEIELLASEKGASVPLQDVASVSDGFEDKSLYTLFKGQPAVTLRVYRVGRQSPLDISDKVNAFVESKRSELPEGIELTVWQDSSYYLRGRLQMMIENAIVGLILVFFVLSLFLRPSLAMWVALGIPISFFGAFALMGPMGTSINLVSLFAFIVVLGILVDDAIVVGESVYSRGRAGEPSLKAAISGTHAVAVPVTFAVLTSIVAFIPMLFLPGWLGKLMKDIPLVVIPVLFFSLVESKFILPFHLSLCKFNKPPSNFFSRIQEKVATGLERFIEKFYSPFLDKCLTHRYLSLSIFVGLFAITIGLILGGHVPAIRGIPPVPSDYISVKLTMQEGMPANSTEKALQNMEQARLAVVEHLESKGEPNPFRHSMLTMGAQPFSGGPAGSRAAPEASHFGEISVELVKSEKRSRSAPEISALWRERLGPLPGMKQLRFLDVAAGGRPIAIDLEISGLDIDQMTAAAEEMKAKLRNFSGLFDISDTHAGGKRELKLKLKPEGRSLGLTQFDLGRQVRQAFYGEEIQRIQRDRDEVKVMLRYPKEERSSLASLAALRIRAPGGIETPLEAVASTEFGPDSPTIRRANRSRTVNIQASANRAIADISAIEAELEKGFIPQIAEKYPDLRFSFVGERKQQQETDSGLGQATGIALFVIYGLLAIPFRSYLQPFLVMSVIPFGLIGAVLGHLLFGITMSQLSIFGLVALTGVVINDSLVLVHWVNSRRAEGMPMAMAARKAGSARFRPILLTSLTTFVGLLPVLFERSLQAQFLKPMAISIGFGVLFATLITLIMVPALYLILEDLRDWTLRFLQYLGWRKEEESPSDSSVIPS